MKERNYTLARAIQRLFEVVRNFIRKLLTNNRAKRADLASNEDVFQILDKAKAQYEEYLRLTDYTYEGNDENLEDAVARDINHPLNIVLK